MKRIILILSVLLLAGCTRGQGGTDPANVSPTDAEPLMQGRPGDDQNAGQEKKIINEAAWCIYWDPDTAALVSENFTRYNELVVFGCIYSEDYSLFIPAQLDELIAELPESEADSGPEIYMSFINDVMHPDGSSTQKSTELLNAVLCDAGLSDMVINDMIKQTKALGFDGIELDYENVHKCEGLWDEYQEFVSKLYQRAQSERLKLRVVLPVSTPAEQLDLVKGPQYTVMCYNLYGNHSGPGPKADEEFLKETYRKFKCIDAGYALANGGFEWGADDKTVRSLTAGDAAALAAEKGAEVVREDSGVLSFSFQAEDGLHTVYYGDDKTMEKWSDILLEEADSDIRIDLWRLE